MGITQGFVTGMNAGNAYNANQRSQELHDLALAQEEAAGLARRYQAIAQREDGTWRDPVEMEQRAPGALAELSNHPMFKDLRDASGKTTRITRAVPMDGPLREGEARPFAFEAEWLDDKGTPVSKGPITDGRTNDPKDTVTKFTTAGFYEQMMATLAEKAPGFSDKLMAARKKSTSLAANGVLYNAGAHVQSLGQDQGQATAQTPVGEAPQPAPNGLTPEEMAAVAPTGLTPAQAAEIKAATTEEEKVALARKYGVPEDQIQAATRGRAGAIPQPTSTTDLFPEDGAPAQVGAQPVASLAQSTGTINAGLTPNTFAKFRTESDAGFKARVARKTQRDALTPEQYQRATEALFLLEERKRLDEELASFTGDNLYSPETTQRWALNGNAAGKKHTAEVQAKKQKLVDQRGRNEAYLEALGPEARGVAEQFANHPRELRDAAPTATTGRKNPSAAQRQTSGQAPETTPQTAANDTPLPQSAPPAVQRRYEKVTADTTQADAEDIIKTLKGAVPKGKLNTVKAKKEEMDAALRAVKLGMITYEEFRNVLTTGRFTKRDLRVINNLLVDVSGESPVTLADYNTPAALSVKDRYAILASKTEAGRKAYKDNVDYLGRMAQGLFDTNGFNPGAFPTAAAVSSEIEATISANPDLMAQMGLPGKLEEMSQPQLQFLVDEIASQRQGDTKGGWFTRAVNSQRTFKVDPRHRVSNGMTTLGGKQYDVRALAEKLEMTEDAALTLLQEKLNGK